MPRLDYVYLEGLVNSKVDVINVNAAAQTVYRIKYRLVAYMMDGFSFIPPWNK